MFYAKVAARATAKCPWVPIAAPDRPVDRSSATPIRAPRCSAARRGTGPVVRQVRQHPGGVLQDLARFHVAGQFRCDRDDGRWIGGVGRLVVDDGAVGPGRCLVTRATPAGREGEVEIRCAGLVRLEWRLSAPGDRDYAAASTFRSETREALRPRTGRVLSGRLQDGSASSCRSATTGSAMMPAVTRPASP